MSDLKTTSQKELDLNMAIEEVSRRDDLPEVVVKILLNHGWTYVEELGKSTRFEKGMNLVDIKPFGTA